MSADSIAIVGLSGRFPGAETVPQFWENLHSGVESIKRFTPEELLNAGVAPDELASASYVPARGWLKSAEHFDAEFFGLSARQAELLDPQQRIFLELAVEALDSAGLDPRRTRQKIGVFGGAAINTYLPTVLMKQKELLDLVGLAQAFTANRQDHLATRVAYHLNLRGPAITVQTACSTSLVALHLACASIRSGECDIALAGGVALSTPRIAGYQFKAGGVLSPDGHCRVFDAAAEGTVIGEGGGLVVLMRWSDAIRRRSNILAMVLGSAVNNDGRGKVGYTAPSQSGQAAVLESAWTAAGIEPRSISYIETHGTGTQLGDPIEVAALTESFRRSTSDVGFCAVGAVKSNIGHLDAAAGIAGIVKTVLAMRNAEIPRTLHFEAPNPQIDFASSPLKVAAHSAPWEVVPGSKRRAGVSAFGFGGTNAHVVLEEWVDAPNPVENFPRVPILLSARSRPALLATARRLLERPRVLSENAPADIANTLARGRMQHGWRVAFWADSAEQIRRGLYEILESGIRGVEAANVGEQICWMFPGQGVQSEDVGRGLWEQFPAYRRELERISDVIQAELGISLQELLSAADGSMEMAAVRAQLVVFSVSWGLAAVWREFGVIPTEMIGHSLGEYVAATVAEVFTLEVAVRLVIRRARLMGGSKPGKMLAVGLDRESVLRLMDQLAGTGITVDFAAHNSESRCVVSGDGNAIENFRAIAEATGATCVPLSVTGAFHSSSMVAAAEAFKEFINTVPRQSPKRPWISCLSGRRIHAEEATSAEYWSRQMVAPVCFKEGIDLIESLGTRRFLEVGPGGVLSGFIAGRRAARGKLRAYPGVRKDGGSSEAEQVFERLTTMWCDGLELDLNGYFDSLAAKFTELPSYPFEHRRYWPSGGATGARRTRTASPNWLYDIAWERLIDDASPQNGRVAVLLLRDEFGLSEAVARCLDEDGVTTRLVNHRDPSLVAEGLRRIHQQGFEEVIVFDPNVALSEGPRTASAAVPYIEKVSEGILQCRELRKVGLIILTKSCFEIMGDETVDEFQALVQGVIRVLPQEDERVSCLQVDLHDREFGVETRQQFARRIADRLRHPVKVQVIALRNGSWWQRRIRERSVEGRTAFTLAPNGVYVVLGGTGGIGAQIAEELSQREGVRLALVHRTPFSLNAGPDTETRPTEESRRSALVESASRRTEVRHFLADVREPGRFSEVLGRVSASMGQIDGIICASGLPGSGVIGRRTEEETASVVASKLQPVLDLEDFLATQDGVRFVVLCSARGSLSGGVGQADYVAANAFLDAAAGRLAKNSRRRVVAIDWPGWSMVGMRARMVTRRRGQVRAMGENPVPTEFARRDGDQWPVISQEMYSARTSWILNEHRILGMPVIPGTAYLDMVCRAAMRLHQSSSVALHSVRFVHPIAVPDGTERCIAVRAEPASEGADEVRFSIDAEGSNSAGQSQKSCAGTFGRDVRKWESGESLESLRKRLAGNHVARDVASPQRIDNGQRWDSLKAVFASQREVLAHLELGPQFADEVSGFAMHPALLDRVNLTARDLLAREELAKSIYLPFSYESIIVRQSLPHQIWMHSRRREDERTNSLPETLTFDTNIYDENGRELVKLVGFSQLRVKDGAAQVRGLFATPSEKHDSQSEKEESGDEISPAEGGRMFWDCLALTELSQVVVSPTSMPPIDIPSDKEFTAGQSSVTGAQAIAHSRPSHLREVVPPRNDIEAAMCRIWAEILGVQEVGIEDDFFALGGDSVQSIQLLPRYEASGFQTDPKKIFECRTISALSQHVSRRSQDAINRPGGESKNYRSWASNGEVTEATVVLLSYLTDFDSNQGTWKWEISEQNQDRPSGGMRSIATALSVQYQRRRLHQADGGMPQPVTASMADPRGGLDRIAIHGHPDAVREWLEKEAKDIHALGRIHGGNHPERRYAIVMIASRIRAYVPVDLKANSIEWLHRVCLHGRVSIEEVLAEALMGEVARAGHRFLGGVWVGSREETWLNGRPRARDAAAVRELWRSLRRGERGIVAEVPQVEETSDHTVAGHGDVRVTCDWGAVEILRHRSATDAGSLYFVDPVAIEEMSAASELRVGSCDVAGQLWIVGDAANVPLAEEALGAMVGATARQMALAIRTLASLPESVDPEDFPYSGLSREDLIRLRENVFGKTAEGIRLP